jgi:hypothetical protein
VYEKVQLDAWSGAMDKALGRTFVGEGDYSAASTELRNRLADQIDAVLAEESDGGLRDVLRDVKTAMARPENALSLHSMTLREPVCRNNPDPRARLKASLMAPDKIESLSVRYTMCI